MILITVLIWALTFCSQGSSNQITITQVPPVQLAALQDTVTMTCKVSSSEKLSGKLSWYQQKGGSNPKLIIYDTNTRYSDTPARFSGHVNITAFSMTITGVQAVDAAVYFCFAHYGSPNLIFGGGTRLEVGTTTTPTLTVLPPSGEELSSKQTASLVCLANGGFPSSWALSWKVDGASRSSSVASSTGLLQSGGLYGWSSTLTLTEQEWSSVKEVTCEATAEGQSAKPSILRKSDCLG